ncbi:glycosyltransferase family 4 protein [Oceanobacillus damuensis]|uniref:glycosyltransferase family 4 protein n=1 Tax=Oceanobacillus damuensis TaxID=937928 RepID=UPI00082C6714|nr:glycosyltransferase family 4 protein [Oceanobacillus damuensis]
MYRVIHIVLNEFNPDFRILKEVISLKENNYDVAVIAINDKSNSKKNTEIMSGVTVYRLNIKSRKFKSKIMLPFKYLEILYKSLKLVKTLEPDVIHVHDFQALPIGYLTKLKFKCKLIYDSHEFREDSNMTKEFPSALNSIFNKVEYFLAKKSDRIITVSEGIADLIHKRVNEDRPAVILNSPYLNNENQTPLINVREKFNISEDSVIITYVGGILPTRGFDLILNAFIKLNNPKLHLLLIGNEDIPNWLKSKYDLEGFERNIHFIPPVHPVEVISLASQADIGVHAIKGESLSHQYCMPNKLFEYIQAGLALLMTDLKEMKKVVHENKIGLTFKDRDEEDLINKLSYLVNNPDIIFEYKANSKRVAKSLNWETEEIKLIELYNKVVEHG